MLHRKNYLFVASVNGGRRAATHDSLVSSAKANGVEPYAWLKAIFTRLLYHRNGHAMSQLKSGGPITSGELDYLLPDIWQQSNPNHTWEIDQIRRDERDAKNV